MSESLATETVTITEAWDATRSKLREQWPDAKEGVLFCVWKLQQDPSLTLRDFRDEAKLRGIALGGRSLHSAKVLLGLEPPAVRRSGDTVRRQRGADPAGESLEDQLIHNVKRIQKAAGAEAARLRKAIRAAIQILEDALETE